MSFYIFLNEQGEELSRKPKGRGRVMSNAIQKEDGNWYVTGKDTSVEAITEPNTEETVKENTEVVSADVPTTTVEVVEKESGNETKTKNIKEKLKINIDTLINSCHVSNNCRVDSDTEIILRGPYITNSKLNSEYIKFNSQYAKIVLNKKDNSVSVWKKLDFGQPDIIIDNYLDGVEELVN